MLSKVLCFLLLAACVSAAAPAAAPVGAATDTGIKIEVASSLVPSVEYLTDAKESLLLAYDLGAAKPALVAKYLSDKLGERQWLHRFNVVALDATSVYNSEASIFIELKVTKDKKEERYLVLSNN